MKTEDKIRAAVQAFLKGGDKRNTQVLNQVLHTAFRSMVNRFAGRTCLSIIPKETYVELIEQGIIGGIPRIITSMYIELAGHVAAAKVRMQSDKLAFTSFYSLILNENEEWQLISDLPFAFPI